MAVAAGVTLLQRNVTSCHLPWFLVSLRLAVIDAPIGTATVPQLAKRPWKGSQVLSVKLRRILLHLVAKRG